MKKTNIVITITAALLLMLTLAACATPAAEAEPAAPDAVGQQPEVSQPEATQPQAEVPAEQPASGSSPETTAEPPTAETGGGRVFAIVPGQSEARFSVNEILNGLPKTVVGATQAVEGTLTPDFNNPANTTVGAFRVDLSTLQTDNNFRNRALRDMILQTGSETNRYAVFTPTSLSGMPDSVTIGEPFTFQISGDLSIRGASVPVTFDVTATAVSETRIEGLATLAPRPYSDFGVSIPRLPSQVASVEDMVTLELAFAAEAQ